MKFFAILAVSQLALAWGQGVDGDSDAVDDPTVGGDGLDDVTDSGGGLDASDTEMPVTTPLCEVDNCITCFETNMCQSCDEGYSATHGEDSEGTCVSCQIQNCAICDDHADECQQCASGYWLETITFTSTTTTATTSQGKTGGKIEMHRCNACTIEGCGECLIEDGGVETCDACAEGYYMAEDGSCTACGTNCDECASVDSNGNVGGCLTCADLYEPEFDGSCGLIGEDCGDYCDVCEEHNQCKTCQDGYSVMIFNNGQSTGCAACPPNCATCADASTCDVCEDSYTLDDISGSCATEEEIVANVCDCRTTTNNGCTCSGSEQDSKEGCCDSGTEDDDGNVISTGMCASGTDAYDGICTLYANNVCTDYDNCAYCFKQSFCGECDVGYYKTQGHPWGACIAMPADWDCDIELLYNDQCECGCGDVDPECAEHQVDNCEQSDDTTGVYCDATGTCADCTIDGCAFCENGDSPTECHECMDGWDLNDDNTCTQCDIDGCSSCQEGVTIVDGEIVTGTVCKDCMDGYYGSITDGDCTACATDNCIQCSADACNKCADGFYLDTEDASCVACSENCLTCGANQCNRCETGFSVVDGACLAEGDCGDNCATCQRGGQCKICEGGYYVGAGTNGKCVGCIDNCDSCRDGDSCMTCSDGYSYDLNEFMCLEAGDCLADVCDCRADSEFADNSGCTCLEDEDTAKLGCCNSDCGKCSDLCEAYTQGDPCDDFNNCEYCFLQTYCFECSEGYYQSDYHGDCIALPDGWTCDLDLLNNNQCDCECGGYDPDCDEWAAEGCASGQYCDSTGTCTDCDLTGCDHCSNGDGHLDGSCLTCTDGHYQDADGNCIDCDLTGCAVCLFQEATDDASEDTYTCKECADGYYQDTDELCASCDITNCGVCANDGSCEECTDGYSLIDGSCNGCPQNCLDCTGDVDVCKRCDDNYEVLDDGTCGSISNDCGDDCEVCGSQGICKVCLDAFYKDSSNACSACMDNCASCTGDSTCSECMSGYGWVDSRSNCEEYSDPLAICPDLEGYVQGDECTCEGWECAIKDSRIRLRH